MTPPKPEPGAPPRRDTILSSASAYARDANPYLGQLIARLGSAYEVRPYTPQAWREPLPQLFHVHWPEQLFRSTGRVRTLIKQATSAVLVRRLIRAQVPIVWTAHNPKPHEDGGALEARLISWLMRHVNLTIQINEAQPEPDGIVILHADYRDQAAHLGLPPRTEAPQQPLALSFGTMRPYKGIETLLDATRDLDPAAGRVLIIGAATPDYQATLQARRRGPAVELRFERPDDQALDRHIQAASLVVLPYRHMINSGALLLALSRGVPVLAPATPTNDAIRDEVGHDWLHTYRGDLTAEALQDALARTATRPAGLPDLSRRDWDTIAHLHERLFRLIIDTPKPLPAPAQLRAQLLAEEPAFGRHSAANR